MTTSAAPQAIKLPDGSKATVQEMHDYGKVLQAFIRDQEGKLAQVEDTLRHNEIIDYLQTLADAYNEQLAIYKAAEIQRQQALLVAMTRVVGG